MRSPTLALLALFLAAPAVAATETTPTDPPREPAPATVAETAPAPAAPEAEMHLTEIQLEERSSDASAADDAQFARRGSFWWLVGVIVVAGVILALLL